MIKIKNCLIITGFTLLLLTGTGCETLCFWREPLPPGQPPENNIIEPGKTEKVFSREKAVNQMVTSLITRAFPYLQDLVGLKVPDTEDHELRKKAESLGSAVTVELQKSGLTNFRNKSKDGCFLESSLVKVDEEKECWSMKIIRPNDSETGEELWREKVLLKTKRISE
jgi:hypothetical protein